jgi:hypothetical protein
MGSRKLSGSGEDKGLGENPVEANAHLSSIDPGRTPVFPISRFAQGVGMGVGTCGLPESTPTFP